jgi:hypothetical protein
LCRRAIQKRRGAAPRRRFRLLAEFSNTGAWSKYAAFGLGVDLPRNALPQNVTASLTGGTGYYWFGNQSAALGGFPQHP